MILKWYQYHFRIVLGSFVVSVRWGHGRARGWETGAFQRAEQPCPTRHQACGRDDGGGHAGGRCAISRTPPPGPPPTLPQPPPFPKRKGTGAPHPCPLVLNLPPPQYPPPSPNTPPPLIKFVKMQPSVLGIFWVKVGHVQVHWRSSVFRACDGELWAVDESKWWGFGVSGPERSSKMACCIFSFQSHDYHAGSGIPLETICRPTQFQLPIFHIIFGVGAWGGWKVPGLSSQVCSWFTSLQPHFRIPWYTNNSKMIKRILANLGP